MERHIFRALTISVLLSMFASPLTHAETGLYIGGSLGNSQVGYKDPEDDLDFDGDDTGYKLFAGFQFTILAVEGGYVDFGKIEDSDYSTELSGFDVFGKLSLGLGPVEVFGKVGGFVWESDFEAASQTFSGKGSDDGIDPAVGIGAAFNLGSLGIRAEYEYFDVGDFDDVSMISVGLAYWFL